MRNSKCMLVFALSAVIALMVCAAATATTPTVTYGGLTPNSPYIYGYITQQAPGSGNPELELWGILSVTISGDPGYNGTYNAVCIDTVNMITNTQWDATLNQGWPIGQVGNTGLSPGTVANLAAWKQLTYLTETEQNWGSFTGNEKAGFQLAAWDLGAGDSTNFTIGSDAPTQAAFGSGPGSVQAWYNTFVTLGQSAPGSWTGSNALWAEETSTLDGGQDMLLETDGNEAQPQVPELPVAALCPMGLALAGLLKRRFLA